MSKLLLPLSFIFAILVALLDSAHAFPEMIRHGYVSCNVCHTSQVGGNLLNGYGRSISKELLSQTSFLGLEAKEGSEGVLHGFVETPEWLTLGGDARLLQAFVESKDLSRGRFLIMQIDLDASAQLNPNWRIFGSVGRLEPKFVDANALDYLTSPRHGVEYIFNPIAEDDRVSLRAGRFMPAYGILFAEHTFVTRSYLDFGPGQERLAAELAWTHGSQSLITTAIFNQASGNQNKVERGGVLQYTTGLGERAKVGFNYYETEREDNTQSFRRRMFGGFAMVGFRHDWYALLDINRAQNADGAWGLFETLKVGHELWQGFQIFGVHEFANLDSSKADPKFESYSIGSQWYPMPHFELYGLYRKERNSASQQNFQDVVWLIGHYYL